MKYATICTAIVACFGVIEGFSVISTTRIQRQHSDSPSLSLVRSETNRIRQQSLVLSTPSDDADDLAKPTDESVPAVEPSQLSTNDSSTTASSAPPKKSWGVTKTILLTVPLFFKFLVVLVIKFMTDLIVFPLLVSYRMCRRAKRKVLGMFETKPNGETRP